MVEIIGHDPSVLKTVTCKNCGAMLRYKQTEVYERRYSCMGDPSGHEYVVCPGCGQDAVIRSW
jgi:hypothetical protein